MSKPKFVPLAAITETHQAAYEAYYFDGEPIVSIAERTGIEKAALWQIFGLCLRARRIRRKVVLDVEGRRALRDS
jgi:hypothetical protein